MVLDPEVFLKEVDTLAQRGVDVSPARLMISKKTHVIMPTTASLDGCREAAPQRGRARSAPLAGASAPCYEDKMHRVGIRAADLADPDLLKAKIAEALVEKNVLFKGPCIPAKPWTRTRSIRICCPWPSAWPPIWATCPQPCRWWSAPTGTCSSRAPRGTHLDIDHGTYPFVTSSNTVTANAASGSGCGPRKLDRIIAIVKAYTTRVGGGPFPTELNDVTGDRLQEVGRRVRGHYGTPPPLRLAGPGGACASPCASTPPPNWPSTKLDVLSGMDELKVCKAYRYRDELVEYPPQEQGGMGFVEPVYESLPGWTEDYFRGALLGATCPATPGPICGPSRRPWACAWASCPWDRAASRP